MHGYTPTMTILEINEETQKAFCIWWDAKTKKFHQEWLPLNVLKHTVEGTPINPMELLEY